MSIELDHVSKRYGSTVVVDGVSLDVGAGELFVLLGPSGSGKSTLLRLIAGLTEVDEGRVSLHGRDVTSVASKDREVGFVFQHYALFRHMTVADNVEFALRVRGVARESRRERREELLALVGLAGYGGRYPRQLSGGQQQRVALARALAHSPQVLLLDEPFGALDARIRLELREALRVVQKELALTTVFVTHDQEEAMGLADRLAVLHQGRLLEVGQPIELYLRPRSPFVATFLGAANLVVAESSRRAVRLGAVELPVAEATGADAPRRVQVLFRPEDVELELAAGGVVPQLGRGTVQERTFSGPFERLRVQLEPLDRVRSVHPPPAFGDSRVTVEALRPQHRVLSLPLEVGDVVDVGVRRFHVLASASLRLLIDTGTTELAQAARELGEKIAARLGVHAGPLVPLAEAIDLGAETASGEEGFDIAVLALEPSSLGAKLDGLRRARHHLLLVPRPSAVPSKLLVGVAVGEPGKADVRFAERFAWQLGARATVLTVLPASGGPLAVPPHVERFLDGCARAMSIRGVVGRSQVRRGDVTEQIRAEIDAEAHDLLVIGAPLVDSGEGPLTGLVANLVREPPPCPILIVRHQTAGFNSR